MKRLQFHLASAARYDLHALARWAAICGLVGAAAGLAGAGFVSAVEGLQHLTLGRPFAIWLERQSEGAAGLRNTTPVLPRWLLPVVPALGGLLCGLIAVRFGNEVYGGGTDTVLQAYHQKHGAIKWHLPFGKWIASALILGTGGSAGREGPMTLVGGGLGSVFGRLFRVGEREQRLLLLAGAGAGVGAVFRIPLGSAIFAIEVLYRDGFEEEGIFPCLIASVTGYSVFIAIHGAGHLFAMPAFPALDLVVLPLFALVGLAVAPFGYLFAFILREVPIAMRLARIPRWLRPCVGGFLVGLLGLVQPEFLGIGYGWAQDALAPISEGSPSLHIVALFLLFAFGKIIATGLTVGSGGSGGTFAPSIVTGCFVGGAIGRVLHLLLPGRVPEPGAFALVGMGALLGGLAHTPLAAVVMVCELAGNYDLLVPLMAAVGVSYILQQRTTLYPAQVKNSAASPARAGGIALDALGTLKVRDLGTLRASPAPIAGSTPLPQLISELAAKRSSVFPVSDEAGEVKQIVTLKTLRAVLDSAELWPHLLVSDAAMPLIRVSTEDSLQKVFETLIAMDCEEIVILDADGKAAGLVGHEDVARLTLQEAAKRG